MTEIYKPEPYSEKSESPLDILYQDASYVVVNKPSGLLVHRSNLDATETRFAVQLLRDQLGRWVFPAHRIDKPASGALLFALDEEALTRATAMFSDNRINKKYLAIVRGFSPESGIINRPLRKLRDGNRKSKSKDAQPSETRFSSLKYSELKYPTGRYQTTRYSLVSLTPRTGRRHQLRRHLAGINHPIIGDTTHGDYRQNTSFRERNGFLRLFLHASDLAFTCPFTDEPLSFKAPIPSDFHDAIKACGLE
ncbi:MAG: pseudouridine synthase [Verrucomicrobiota bacterium]|nr:pseudouridine synthase [Verrucomicrobiota bacterium]